MNKESEPSNSTLEMHQLSIEEARQRITDIESREVEIVKEGKDADAFVKELTQRIESLEHDTEEMTAILRVKEREEEKLFRLGKEKERLFKEKEGLHEILKLIETADGNDLERAARAFEGAGAFRENNRLAA